MKVLFLGDIMPGGVLPYRVHYINNQLLDWMCSFELRIGTLECAVGDNLPMDPVKMAGRQNIIFCRPKDADKLNEMKIDVVSLANNHVYDLGKEGLASTMSWLDAHGIKHCGAGMNIAEASAPVVVEIDGKKLGFYACCEYGSAYIGHLQIATETEPGVNALDLERVVEDIKRLKSQCDYVFVLPHWGQEYQYLPTPKNVFEAKAMIEAGADGVFASHPHQIQPWIRHKDRPIAFSMGNYLFPDFFMAPPRPIFYPEGDVDESSMPRFYGYPKKVDVPTVQVWRHLSRIGMAVSCTINDSDIRIHPTMVYTEGRSNCLDYYMTTGPMNLRMAWMGRYIKLPYYNSWFKIYHSKWNVVRRGFHLLRKIIAKR